MVSSAVLGAAAGTGLALVVAMTIVIYRYYAYRRRDKDWGNLERFGDARFQSFGAEWKKVKKKKDYHNYVVINQKEFNVASEQHSIQPRQTLLSPRPTARSPFESVSPILAHQSRPYVPSTPRFIRAPSVSSQSSFDSSESRQGLYGSSPQIRTFAPDGRSTSAIALHQYGVASDVGRSKSPFSPSTSEAAGPSQSPIHYYGTASSEAGPTKSRSPSPFSYSRAVSLDIRCSSPTNIGSSSDLRTPSPTLSSLNSLTDRYVSSFGNSPGPVQSRSAAYGRCLSPLLIPPASIQPPAPPASPLGTLQPDLYQRTDGPLFLRTCEEGTKLGRLHMRLSYDFNKSDLLVHIIEAHDLVSSDQGGFNDPYVRLTLLPMIDNRRRQTSIHRSESNPFFDHQFQFPVAHDELKEKTLVLQIFDFDKFSTNDIIGEVRMNMTDFDVTNSVEVWGDICSIEKPRGEVQEVLVSLSYLPQAEKLSVVVVKARNLFVPEPKERIDPFAKVYLMCDGKRLKKKRTTTRRGDCDPKWNELLMYRLPYSSLRNTSVEISVMDQASDLLGKDPMLGCCVIGLTAEGSGRNHWLEMNNNHHKVVTMWHTLRPFQSKTEATIASLRKKLKATFSTKGRRSPE